MGELARGGVYIVVNDLRGTIEGVDPGWGEFVAWCVSLLAAPGVGPGPIYYFGRDVKC